MVFNVAPFPLHHGQLGRTVALTLGANFAATVTNAQPMHAGPEAGTFMAELQRDARY